MDRASLFSPANLGFVRAAVIRRSCAWPTSCSTRRRSSPRCGGCRAGLPSGRLSELCLTGYSCADLFYQDAAGAAAAALDEIALEAHMVEIAVVVGLPLEVDGRLFNCAAFIATAGAGHRPEDLPPFHQRVLRGTLVHVGSLAIQRDGRDRRAVGAVRLRSAVCRATICRTA